MNLIFVTAFFGLLVYTEHKYGRLQELSEHLLEPHLFPEDL